MLRIRVSVMYVGRFTNPDERDAAVSSPPS